jgi:hypothetical protein
MASTPDNDENILTENSDVSSTNGCKAQIESQSDTVSNEQKKRLTKQEKMQQKEKERKEFWKRKRKLERMKRKEKRKRMVQTIKEQGSEQPMHFLSQQLSS